MRSISDIVITGLFLIQIILMISVSKDGWLSLTKFVIWEVLCAGIVVLILIAIGGLLA